MKIDYTSDLLIFGIDSRESGNVRSLPKKYFSLLIFSVLLLVLTGCGITRADDVIGNFEKN